MMLRWPLVSAALASAVSVLTVFGASAQPAPGNEIHILSRCTGDYDRCENSIAAAAKTAPDVTRAFLAFCAGHFAACEDRIIMVDRQNVVSARRRCIIGVRGTAELPETVKTILAWLAQHPAVAERKTDDGVTAAVAALWPC
jgi:Rap1a immunity proteins